MSYESLGSDDAEEIEIYIGKYLGERNEKEERHGQGAAQLPNGDEYEGQYQGGQRHGYGKYTFVSRKARYEGEYEQNERSGQGTFWYPDGSVYEGAWAGGQRNGYGVYMYANGDRYEGEWKEDRRHGSGKYIYKEHDLIYNGNWGNGRFEGEGHLIAPNYTYRGNFTGEQPVGPGRFHFDMGCEQVGEYVTMRKVRRTNTSREVVHVPVWRCLALHEEAPRVMKPKKLPS